MDLDKDSPSESSEIIRLVEQESTVIVHDLDLLPGFS
jgi:hypothetical protein